jgi:hypothetical protein
LCNDLENFFVSLLARDEQVSQLLGLDAEDVLALLLEALHPLVVGHVDDVDGQDEPPVEGVELEVALLAPEHAVVLILDLVEKWSMKRFRCEPIDSKLALGKYLLKRSRRNI